MLFEWGTPAKGHYTPAVVPYQIKVASMFLSLVTLATICVCVMKRFGSIRSFKKLSVPGWILLAFYVDAFIYVLLTTIIKDIGANISWTVCGSAIFICLLFYLTAKMLVYFFLIEKVQVVRGVTKTRLEDKLYLFNCFGMAIPWVSMAVLAFYWRIAYIDKSGICIIGVHRKGVIPLLSLDIVINVYLTALFVIPLRQLYSYKTGEKCYLRTTAFRALVGCFWALSGTVGNALLTWILDGEPGWLCFITCNGDMFVSVVVLYWMTNTDQPEAREYKFTDDSSLRNSKAIDLHDTELSATIMSNCETTIHNKGDEDVEENRIRVTYERNMKVEVDECRSGRLSKMQSDETINPARLHMREPSGSSLSSLD